MISYFGYPVNFPDNTPFGTLCVLDSKERHFASRHDNLLMQFKNVIEFDLALALIPSFTSNPEQLSKTIHDQQAQLVLSNAELRKSLEKAEESEKRFRSIIDNTHAGYFFINNEGIFEKVNRAWLDLYKYDSFDEVIGKHFTEVQRIEDRESARKYVEEIKKRNPDYSIGEYSRLCKDDTTGYHSFSANPVVIDNISIGIEGFIFDITDRKLAENKLLLYAKELNELNTDKDRFISIIAHDLKSPFSALLGFSDLLKENIHTYDIGKIEVQVNIINQTIKRTYNLLEDILLWARSQLGKLVFSPKKIDFRDTCCEVIENLREQAGAKNIRVNCFSSETVSLMADLNMFKTIVRNLLSNAIKFSERGREINVYAEIENDFATITFSDKGVGIMESDIPGLWDISRQHVTAGTEGEVGTGLGLILCKEFVLKHGGKIWVESEFGKGSNFKFTIPIFI
jgi:PAS domain S-box-containing protein